MTGQNLKSARAVAADVLNRFDPNKVHASNVLNRYITRTKEKQRATDLVFGTIRNRSAIDTVICSLTGRTIKRIPDNILTRRSRNQKSYKLLFTLLGISPTIPQIENLDMENMDDAELYRAAQY